MFCLGVSFACGMASTFKYVAEDFPDNMGAISGIVGLAGGLGGFLLPILWGILLDATGVYSSCFMLLYGIVWVSLILAYITEVRRIPTSGGRIEERSSRVPTELTVPAGCLEMPIKGVVSARELPAVVCRTGVGGAGG